MQRRPETPLLSLPLDEIEEGISQFEFSAEPETLELSDSYFAFAGPLHIRLRVSRALETFHLSGLARCRIKGECCRCLAAVEREFEVELAVLLQRKQASEDELQAAAEEADIDILPPGTRAFALGEFVRDAVIIDLPVRIYCREQCRGLCSQCGHDLNQGPCSCQGERVDPRWEALRKIKL